MALSKDEQTKLQVLFGIPEEFIAEALKMLSSQEIQLIFLMEKNIIPEEQLLIQIAGAGIADDPKKLLLTAYRRAVINKVRDEHGSLCYQVADFYTRYPYYAQFEPEEYRKFSRETKERLNAWDFEVYYGVYGKDVKAKMAGIETYVHNSTYLTLPEADKLIEKHRDHICLVPCNCKEMMDVTKKPRNVCLQFETGDNSFQDRGVGEPVTMERAKELVRYFNRSGLMQNGEDFAICNCDGESCYPLQMARKAGSRGIYPRSNYRILWHKENCINCGKCTRICNFGAFTIDASRKVSFHPDLCWGCTICSENCPKGAITLEELDLPMDTVRASFMNTEDM
ncbi:MAG: 4Fe-4S binding protein [Clostridium sp.]|nr:4Fe-4S binding protein [Clostridium sp.]